MSKHGWGYPGTLVVGDGREVKGQGVEMERPELCTVTATLDLSNVPASVVVSASLLVDFTVKKGRTQRIIDLASAASISGLADQVLAMVRDESPTRTADTYGVTLTMTRYPRPGGVTPVRTGFNGAISGTSFQTIPVPPGATGVYVFGGAFAGLHIQQCAKQDASVIVAESDVTIGQYMPLSQGARFIKLENTSSGSTQATVQFAIDG